MGALAVLAPVALIVCVVYAFLRSAEQPKHLSE
jgi:hypothetical protein